MARPPTGHVYFDHGSRFAAFSILGKREHFRLPLATTDEEATKTKEVMLKALIRLRKAGKETQAKAFLEQIAASDARRQQNVMVILDGVVRGVELEAPPAPPPPTVLASPRAPDKVVTFGEFAEQWVSGELARLYPDRVKAIRHANTNRERLNNHILHVVFQGRRTADVPLHEFTQDHAEYILRLPTLPAGSRRHVAVVINRLLNLAVTPARLIPRSPLPTRWLPIPNAVKARSWLYPTEVDSLMGYREAPLVKRLYIGVAVREGPRRGNLVNLDWASLDLAKDRGTVTFDETKGGEGIAWRLDPGTAEALRRWKRICPSKTWVFPELAVPADRKRKRRDRPMYVTNLSRLLRGWLLDCGVDRPQLHTATEKRLALRAHDLRATFVTVALAVGKTDSWVMDRTGHKSYQMLARYKRSARMANEMGVQWFAELHEVVPELAALGESATGTDVVNGLTNETTPRPLGKDRKQRAPTP
ncbi:MAG: tyrosine-type recombinase/integrase [Polyangiaceae bacterium]|nr:tyrosine-type recombinase/integrase [Polyangiaceae bacterium]